MQCNPRIALCNSGTQWRLELQQSFRCCWVRLAQTTPSLALQALIREGRSMRTKAMHNLIVLLNQELLPASQAYNLKRLGCLSIYLIYSQQTLDSVRTFFLQDRLCFSCINSKTLSNT